ncbi:MAG: hypothetical protein ACO3F1_00145 [Ilumatobacteraceae bacterium]
MTLHLQSTLPAFGGTTLPLLQLPMTQSTVMDGSLPCMVIISVMHGLPADCRLVTLVRITRPSDTCRNGVKFTLDSVSLGVCMRTQLGF